MDLTQYGGISNGDGSYTFTLKDGEHFDLTNIPVGYKYEISEAAGKYDTTVDYREGSTTGEKTLTEDITHKFENQMKYDLTFSKEVTGNMGNKEKEFEFAIKVWEDVEPKEYMDLTPYGGIDNGDGSYTFKLKHGDSITIPNIPSGYEYEIIETDYSNEGYKTKVDNTGGREKSGTITEDKEHEFENRLDGPVPTEVKVARYGLLLLLLFELLLVYKKRKAVRKKKAT